MLSLLYGRGRYGTSSERELNILIKTQAMKKQKQVISKQPNVTK